jgi:hypothetical protein
VSRLTALPVLCFLLTHTPAAHAQRALPGALPPDDPSVVQNTKLPELVGVPLPHFPSAVDPVTSAPTPGALPELSAPPLDMIAGTLQASKNGAVVKGVVSPLLFLDEPVLLLSETRIEIHGASSELQPWGASLATGYSSATSPLQNRLTATEQAQVTEGCALSNHARKEEATGIATALAASLDKAPGSKVGPKTDVETQDDYISRVYVAWTSSDPVIKASLAARAAQLEHASYAADDSLGDCWMAKAALLRMTKAYGAGFAARVSGGADFFPVIEGPDVVASPGKPSSDPAPHSLAMWNVGVALGYFIDRTTRLWLTGSYSRKRAKTTVDALDSRVGFGVDIAHNLGASKVDATGFAAGFAVGGFAAIQSCLDDGGCPEAITAYDEVLDDPLHIESLASLGVYVDVRSSAALQIRVGLPFTMYSVAKGPVTNDRELIIWGFAPTVSLTVASWTLRPTTSY